MCSLSCCVSSSCSPRLQPVTSFTLIPNPNPKHLAFVVFHREAPLYTQVLTLTLVVFHREEFVTEGMAAVQKPGVFPRGVVIEEVS